MKKLAKSLPIIGLLLISESLFAWGIIGHRVVGQVAENHLTKKTAKKVHAILDGQTLADVSNWMDDVKSDRSYDHMYDWHWVTIPNGKRYKDTEKNPKGDAYVAITSCIDALKKGGLTKEEEAEKIKILVHVIGDVHQPLHVGNGTDKGGNDVKVKWFGKNSNIHRVWDSQMIDSKQYSYTELTTKVDRFTKAEISALQAASVEDWLIEAQALHEQVYTIGNKERMGYEYRYKNFATVEKQLGKAGIRLAGVLNSIYGK